MSATRRRRRGGSPLRALLDTLGSANLPGVYTRDGVRLSTAGTVACVDDARCSTATGRLLMPRAGIGFVNLGNQAALDGLTKLTVLGRVNVQSLAAALDLVARALSVSDGTSAFQCRIQTSGQIALAVWDGTGLTFSTNSPSAAVVGTEAVCAWVFDGTQGVPANRVQLGVANRAAGAFPAMTLAASGQGSAPAALATTATSVAIGARSDGGVPFVGPVDTIAIYIGQALTAAQIDAEIASGYAGAQHRYTFDGTLADSGVTGGWNGAAVGTGLAYCSDDTRWGGILMGGSGSANPSWDATNREILFDGFDDYLKGVGTYLAVITATSRGMAWIGTFPTPTASDQRFVELADGLTGGNSGGYLGEFAGAGSVGIAVPPALSATNAGLYSAFPGVRVLHGRLTDTGGGTGSTNGASVGSGAETTTGLVQAIVSTLSVFVGSARGGGGSFAGGKWRGLVLYKGDYAGKQPYVNQLALDLGASL